MAWNGGSDVIGGAYRPARVLGLPLGDDDALGAEVLGVVGDVGHVGVAGRQPHAAEAVGVGHQAPLPRSSQISVARAA